MGATEVMARMDALGLEVLTDGTRLLVGPRSRLTDEVRTLLRTHRDALIAIALAESIIRSRPDAWGDPEPDVCETCGAPAIGYSPAIFKACECHLDGGLKWMSEGKTK